MLRIIGFLFILLCMNTLYGQTDRSSIPYTLTNQIAKMAVFYTMDSVDASREIELNEQQNKDRREKIMQYGKELKVDFNLSNFPQKDTLKNGDVVYRLGIYCANAVSINLVFDQFKLKMGSLLYLVGANSKKYIGAYTSLNNSQANVLGTELVDDDKVIIELVEPKQNTGTSLLHLGSVIHGFRSLETLVKRSLNSSGVCNIDVNCPQGKGFEKQRDAVAMIINSAGGFCTGTLVNTTAGPYKPYFLSAYHCGTNPTSWVFRFRWESPDSSLHCGVSKPSVNGPTDKTINGATLVASYKTTDFILCELNSPPNPLWNVYYAGWDNSGNIPLQGTSIHHPLADIKKVSLDNKTLIAEGFNIGDPNNHWRTNWDQGVTEPGSSGSPLFDQNHRVIGQLHGGDSDCISKFLTDYYGKFSDSWKGGGDSSSRLSDWLDPVNAQVNILDGSSNASYDPFIPYFASNLKGNLCIDSLTPYVIFSNAGSDTLRKLTISYSFDKEGLNELTWNGKLGLYQKDTIFLPGKKFSTGTHDFIASIVKDTNFVDDEESNNLFTSSFKILKNPKKYYLNLHSLQSLF